MYFSKQVCQFLLICFQVYMSKISAESDKFSNLFGVFFFYPDAM